MSNTNKKIAIIGAGLTGTMLSLYMAKRGHQVTLFEQRPDEKMLSEINFEAGRVLSLDLSIRGFLALEDVDLMDEIRPLIVPMITREIHLPTKKTLSIPYGIKEDEFISTVSRFKLHRSLMKKIQNTGSIKIEFNKRFLNYDLKKKEVTFLDQQNSRELKDSFDVVFGCDGVHSQVRDYVENETKIPFIKTPFGFAYKVVNIPKDLTKVLKFKAMHMWFNENAMLAAQPNFDGSFSCALILAKEGDKSFKALLAKTDDEIKDFFRSMFPNAYELIPNLVQEIRENPEGHFTTIKGGKWGINDSLLLLGDAVHAMTPFLGQGANSCFEDCYLFNKYLDLFNDDFGQAIATFERNRKSDAESVTTMSVENYPELTNMNWESFLIEREVESFIMNHFKKSYTSYHNLICFNCVPYNYANNIRSIQKELIQRVSKKIKDPNELSVEFVTSDFNYYLEKKKIIDSFFHCT